MPPLLAAALQHDLERGEIAVVRGVVQRAVARLVEARGGGDLEGEQLLQQAKGSLSLLALLTGSNGGIVAHHIRYQQLVGHLLQQAKGPLPLFALLACTNGGILAHNIWRQQLLEHVL